jgi:hypothetical protein
VVRLVVVQLQLWLNAVRLLLWRMEERVSPKCRLPT